MLLSSSFLSYIKIKWSSPNSRRRISTNYEVKNSNADCDAGGRNKLNTHIINKYLIESGDCVQPRHLDEPVGPDRQRVHGQGTRVHGPHPTQ